MNQFHKGNRFFFCRGGATFGWLLLSWIWIGAALPDVSPALPAADVQLAVPGRFAAPFDFLNAAVEEPMDINQDGTVDIRPPCSCRGSIEEPISSLKSFDDQIIIATGTTGQRWQIRAVSGALDPATHLPLEARMAIPEIGNSGVYVLPVVHLDGVGYTVSVEAPDVYPDQVFGPFTQVCHYPRPVIDNLEPFYCAQATDVILKGGATSAWDDHAGRLLAQSENWSIVRKKDGAVFPGSVLSPSRMGEGTYLVRYTYDAGNFPLTRENRTGCTAVLEKEIIIRATPPLACNIGINLAVPPGECAVTISPEMLLVNRPDDYSFLSVQVRDPNGNSLGNSVPAKWAGKTLRADVIDVCRGIVCSSTVTVSDVHPPELQLPPDVELACTQKTDTSVSGTARALDCSPVTLQFRDDKTETFCGQPVVRIFRTWTATDAFGNSASAVQSITVRRADPGNLIFPPDLTFTCEQYLADPSLTDPKKDKAGLPTLVLEPRCGLGYSWKDDTLRICPDGGFGFTIVREWKVLNHCENVFYERDALGNDNRQFIKVIDNRAPEVKIPTVILPANLSPAENGLASCSSSGLLPAPQMSDDCSNFTVRIFTPLGEAHYVNGRDGKSGGWIPLPGLPPGEHRIRYEAEDACGNQAEHWATVVIADQTPPVAVCNPSVGLSLTNTGFGRIFPSLLDEASSDNCCIDRLQVRLLEEPESAFRDAIDLYCTYDTVRVVLRVWDCAGNFNDCVSEIIAEDRQPVRVLRSVPDITLTCREDYQPYLDPAYQAPEFADDCDYRLQTRVTPEINECGVGRIIREWIAVDNPSNPPAVVRQVITVKGLFQYRLFLPEDGSDSCSIRSVSDPEYEIDDGCVLFSVSTEEEPLDNLPSGHYSGKKRIHHLINWCEYDGESPPLILPRIDGPDAGTVSGDEYHVRQEEGKVLWFNGNTEISLGRSNGYYQYEQWVLTANCRKHYTISGNIRLPDGEAVVGAKIRLEGAESHQEVTTDREGNFQVEVTGGTAVSLIPARERSYLNGVSTLDLILITKHITRNRVFTDPYKIIAADVNRSKSITTLDLILLQKAILGVNDAFPNNTSWRFIPQGHKFRVPSNPFMEEFPEQITMRSLSADTAVSFVGIKVGDVNNSVSGENLAGMEERSSRDVLFIRVPDTLLVAGEETTVFFEVEKPGLAGFQFTLEADPVKAEILSINPVAGISPGQLGRHRGGENWWTVSWFENHAVEKVTLAVKVRPNTGVHLSEAIHISSRGVAAEAYHEVGEEGIDLLGIDLEFVEKKPGSGLILFPNTPNPFMENTRIRFYVEEKTNIYLAVFDSTGKIVKLHSNLYEKGFHEVEVRAQELSGEGMYFCRLRAEDQVQTQKMLMMKRR